MLLQYPTLTDINRDRSMWLKCLANKFKNFTHNVDNDEEDEFSLQLHELAMQTEMRKREKDIDFLKKRMRYTFQQRKEWIALNHPKVADIVTCFPAIIHSEELWHQEVELDVGLAVPTCRAFLASNVHQLRKALNTPQVCHNRLR